MLIVSVLSTIGKNWDMGIDKILKKNMPITRYGENILNLLFKWVFLSEINHTAIGPEINNRGFAAIKKSLISSLF